jgi:hypothetical protein
MNSFPFQRDCGTGAAGNDDFSRGTARRLPFARLIFLSKSTVRFSLA